MTLADLQRASRAVGVLLALAPALAAGNCESLAALATPAVEIVSAGVVRTGTFHPPTGKPLIRLPPFCQVTAVLHPLPDSAIRLELWMPEANWNSRLEGTGNGGFAGTIAYTALADGLRRGYAVVNTDMGMATPPGSDATIFTGRPERWKDWGYRATHEMTVQAKRLVAAYYSRPAARSYFAGCSTGGQQALMEAQRYPDDYDGIVGGAPANNRTGVHESILWNFIAAERAPQDRLSPAKLRRLATAVMNACDRIDGVTDGILTDPRECSFEPSSLQCPGAESENCLTAKQVETVRQLYSGPVNPRTGQPIYPGLPKGSELAWDRLSSANRQPPFAPIFKWVFGKSWDWRTFDFDKDSAAFDKKLAPTLNAVSPNLDTFRARGHKLLVYHGWADWLVPPGETLNYRRTLAAKLSAADLDRFYRLFMVPGMAHCGGGVGPNRFDALSAMVSWVEQGRAPDRIVASEFPSDQDSGKPLRTRPLCPYPFASRYRGHGSVDDGANYLCIAPTVPGHS